MGAICSKGCGEGRGKRGKMKIKAKRKKQEESMAPDFVDPDPDEEMFPDTYLDEEEEQEREEITLMRTSLHDDLPMFVINNVLMSVQFFENFDREISSLRAESRADRQDLDGHRLKHFQADKLMDKIGTSVTYRPKRGPQKDTKSLLHPLRSYLVYQNVQIKMEDTLQVGSPPPKPNPPFYKLQCEAAEDAQLSKAGYVNLREIESEAEEVIYASIDDLATPKASQTPRRGSNETPGNDGYETLRRDSNEQSRRSSAADSEVRVLATRLRHSLLQVKQSQDTLYGYTTILALTASRSLQQVRRGRVPTSSCAIPKESFTEIKKPILFSARRTGNRGELLSTITYLNSRTFLSQFWDVLAERLADPLKLVRELPTAPVQSGRVVITKGIVTHHITPVLPVPFWPYPAQNFLRPNTKQFGWPTQPMQRRVEKLGAYLLPLGFLKLRGQNPDFELQWRFICPTAEEYLLLRTMHSHIRCYLFTLAIFKSFLISDDNFLGLDHTHILHLLFSQIHKNYVNWPEDKPAVSLLHFLQVLHNAIQERKIRDFFIEDRNLLESSPSKFLNKAQGTLSKILENPMPFTLQAIKNLRMRSSFYPELDISYIYKLATTTKIMEFLNPHLVQKRKPPKSDDEDLDEDSEDEERLWKEKYVRQKKEEQAAKIETHKGSTETINLEEKPPKDDEPERRRALLEKFIPHFMEMGKKSAEYEAFNQAQLYFLHAKRLTRLLKEEQIDAGEVQAFEEQIQKEVAKCEKQAAAAAGNRTSAEVKKDEDSNVGIRLSLHTRDLPQVPVSS